MPTDSLLHVVWGEAEWNSDSDSDHEENVRRAAARRKELREYGVVFKSEESESDDEPGLPPSAFLEAPPRRPLTQFPGSPPGLSRPLMTTKTLVFDCCNYDEDGKSDGAFAQRRSAIRAGFSSSSTTASTGLDSNENDEAPERKKKVRLCKEKRERYKKITAKLTNQILMDPDSFDVETLHLPASMPESIKSQLIATMTALQQDSRQWRYANGLSAQQQAPPRAVDAAQRGGGALPPGPLIRDM